MLICNGVVIKATKQSLKFITKKTATEESIDNHHVGDKFDIS